VPPTDKFPDNEREANVAAPEIYKSLKYALFKKREGPLHTIDFAIIFT